MWLSIFLHFVLHCLKKKSSVHLGALTYFTIPTLCNFCTSTWTVHVCYCIVALLPPHPQQLTHTHTHLQLAADVSPDHDFFVYQYSQKQKKIEMVITRWTTRHYNQPCVTSWTNLTFHLCLFKLYLHVMLSSWISPFLCFCCCCCFFNLCVIFMMFEVLWKKILLTFFPPSFLLV